MASITLSTETLEDLDSWNHDLVVLTFFEDERPLKGLNGLADWRYRGKLSQFLMDESFKGRMGEKLLTNSDTYLTARRVLIYGLGSAEQFDNIAFVRVGEDILKISRKMKAESVLMALPGTKGRDPYLLDRMAVIAKQVKSLYKGDVTIMVDRRENLVELRAKFDLIDRELGRIVKTKGQEAGSQPQRVVKSSGASPGHGPQKKQAVVQNVSSQAKKGGNR